MATLFETPRSIVRHFQPEDAEVMVPWLTDAEIMRYIPTGHDGLYDGLASLGC